MNRREYWLMVVLALIAGLVGGAVSSMFFIGEPVFAQKTPQHPKVITAEEFRLLDKDGYLLARLGIDSTSPGSLATFALFGRSGKPFAELGYLKYPPSPESPMLALHSGGESVIVQALMGMGGFKLKDEKGKIRASLDLLLDIPVLRLNDKDGRPRVLLTLDGDGNPSLNLRDENQKGRAVLGSTSLETTRIGEVITRPVSSLVLFDKDEKVIWSVP